MFDMAQSVLLSHPMASMFLKRDLVNLHRYFKKLGVEVLSPEEIYRTIVEDDAT
ncbi:MAG: RIO1 family regulatory kinase/ATPase [Candidatus Bathyarchaeia archaeon]